MNINTILFGEIEALFDWRKEWQDMPEYSLEDRRPVLSITVHFAEKEDYLQFSELIKQNITENTKSIYFPKADSHSYKDKTYIDES